MNCKELAAMFTFNANKPEYLLEFRFIYLFVDIAAFIDDVCVPFRLRRTFSNYQNTQRETWNISTRRMCVAVHKKICVSFSYQLLFIQAAKLYALRRRIGGSMVTTTHKLLLYVFACITATVCVRLEHVEDLKIVNRSRGAATATSQLDAFSLRRSQFSAKSTRGLYRVEEPITRSSKWSLLMIARGYDS